MQDLAFVRAQAAINEGSIHVYLRPFSGVDKVAYYPDGSELQWLTQAPEDERLHFAWNLRGPAGSMAAQVLDAERSRLLRARGSCGVRATMKPDPIESIRALIDPSTERSRMEAT